MTYQLGAECLLDPYMEDVQVSLSELNDARFVNSDSFACGHDFVIGYSCVPSYIMRCTPMKKHRQLSIA